MEHWRWLLSKRLFIIRSENQEKKRGLDLNSFYTRRQRRQDRKGELVEKPSPSLPPTLVGNNHIRQREPAGSACSERHSLAFYFLLLLGSLSPPLHLQMYLSVFIKTQSRRTFVFLAEKQFSWLGKQTASFGAYYCNVAQGMALEKTFLSMFCLTQEIGRKRWSKMYMYEHVKIG